MKLLVDNEMLTTLDEFLHTNTKEKDVEHITDEDVEIVKNLKPGEPAYIGTCEVRRIL